MQERTSLGEKPRTAPSGVGFSQTAPRKQQRESSFRETRGIGAWAGLKPVAPSTEQVHPIATELCTLNERSPRSPLATVLGSFHLRHCGCLGLHLRLLSSGIESSDIMYPTLHSKS
jgi:hypothetical protein